MHKSLIYSGLSFVIILLATILIILYGNGYTYNIQSQKIQKTGIIKITSTPSGASVYINDRYKGTTPYSAFNLAPQDYTVTVKKDSYLLWTTRITVKGGQLASLYPILYPSTLTPERLESNADIANIYFGQGQYTYTALDKDNQLNLYVHYFGSSFLNIGESTQLLADISKLGIDPNYRLDAVQFSPGGTKALLVFTGANLPTKYFYISSNTSIPATDLDTQIDTTQYQKIIWGKDDNHLLLSTATILVSLDVGTGQRVLLYQGKKGETLTDFTVAGNLIYLFEHATLPVEGYSIVSEQLDGTNPSTLTNSKIFLGNAVAAGNNYAYTDQANGIAVFYPSISPNPIIIPSSKEIIPVSFSPDANILLYKDTTGTVYTYTMDTKDIHTLAISINDINHLTWSNSARILLYTTKNTDDTSNTYYTLKGINFDGSNNDTIFTGPITNSTFMVSPKTGEIIFEMNNLSSSPTVTEKGIYQIAIPGI